MPGRFAPERRRALRDLLRLTGAEPFPGGGRLEIAAVREALGLPEPPCRAWLAADRWLLGGAVLCWLQGGPEGERSKAIDYDLYFSSLEAFNRGISDFLAAGFTFSCFQLWGDRCPFCGLEGSLERRDASPPTGVPPAKAGCRSCEPAGAVGRWGREVIVTPQSLAASGLVAVDLLSPEGEVFQLAAIAFEPSLDRLMASVDYSVCQLGLDDRSLCFGRHTWSDLFKGRLRMENLHRTCYVRLRKYMKKGFSPDPMTLARALGSHLYFWARDRRIRSTRP
jgi:hypothetical protein